MCGGHKLAQLGECLDHPGTGVPGLAELHVPQPCRDKNGVWTCARIHYQALHAAEERGEVLPRVERMPQVRQPGLRREVVERAHLAHVTPAVVVPASALPSLLAAAVVVSPAVLARGVPQVRLAGIALLGAVHRPARRRRAGRGPCDRRAVGHAPTRVAEKEQPSPSHARLRPRRRPAPVVWRRTGHPLARRDAVGAARHAGSRRGLHFSAQLMIPPPPHVDEVRLGTW